MYLPLCATFSIGPSSSYDRYPRKLNMTNPAKMDVPALTIPTIRVSLKRHEQM